MKRYAFTDSPRSINETVLATVYARRYGDTLSFLRPAHIVIAACVVRRRISRYYTFLTIQICVKVMLLRRGNYPEYIQNTLFRLLCEIISKTEHNFSNFMFN